MKENEQTNQEEMLMENNTALDETLVKLDNVDNTLKEVEIILATLLESIDNN